jgi:crossover junction endodeoxyribonuclease RusA
MSSGWCAMMLLLPWPPSVNSYWRRAGSRMHISHEGRAYRASVAERVMLARAERRVHGEPAEILTGRLRVKLTAAPPDRRARDLDNILKSTLDSLEHAQVFVSDSQIDDLRIVREPPNRDGGSVRAIIEEIG